MDIALQRVKYFPDLDKEKFVLILILMDIALQQVITMLVMMLY